MHLKPVNRGGRQAGERDGLLNRSCRDRRPRAGCRSVHYRITDEIRLCTGYLFDVDSDLAGIRTVIQGTERIKIFLDNLQRDHSVASHDRFENERVMASKWCWDQIFGSGSDFSERVQIFLKTYRVITG